MVGARQNYSPHITPVTKFQIAQASNSTDSSFPSRVPTTTKPAGAGVNEIPEGVGVTNNILIVPFGTDAANEAFDMRIIGWQQYSTVWIPVILSQATCTLSAVTGVDSTDLENENFLADTVVLVTGTANVSTEVVSPTGDVVGHVVVDIKGFSVIEFTFDLNTAASANALFKRLS